MHGDGKLARVGLDVRILGLGGPLTGIPSYIKRLVEVAFAGNDDDEWILFADRAVRGYPVRRVAKWPGLPWLQTALPWAASQAQLSVFHGPAFALPRWGAFRRVVTIHDLGYLRYPQFVEPAVVQYLRRMVPMSLKAADGIIVPTPQILEEVYAAYPAIRAKPGRVIPMAASLGPPLQGLPRPRERPYLLHVGTIEPRKNLGTLLEAFAWAVGQGMDRHDLVCVGAPGLESARFQARLKELGLQERVVVEGYVDDAALSAWYRYADAYVQPSWYEGFGMGTLEAYVQGLRIVATPTGWIAGVTDPGVRLVEPDNAQAMGQAMLEGVRAAPSPLRRDQVADWPAVLEQHRRFYHEMTDQ